MSKVVIIGNGISGVTAARHIRKNSDNEILIISGESEHYYSRTALMYIYMGHMRYEDTKPYEDWFWEKNRIDLLFDFVTSIDVENKLLKMKSGPDVSYDSLIIATGSKPNKFGWPGEDLDGVQGLYSIQDLELLEKNTKDIKRGVVVGGGLIGVELAEMLLSRGIDVTFLVRESEFAQMYLPPNQSKMISAHIRDHHVDLRLASELKGINGEGDKVKSITTKDDEEISCQFVGLCVGVGPNIDFVKSSGIDCDKGVLVNEYLETSAPNVYAIGDCAQFKDQIKDRKIIEQLWYTGRMHGETVAQTICGNKLTYQPGPWFNSAKFFDIEYQTYGHVYAKPQEHEAQFHWEKPEKNLSVHVVYDKNTTEFIGINLLGLRMRHELFDQWIRDKASVVEVMSELRSANFDPEFYSHYEKEIVDKFNSETSLNVQLKSKKWWRELLKTT